MPTQAQNLAERSTALGLRAINWLASSELVDRVGLREPTERLLRSGSKNGMRAATRAGRTFAAVSRLGQPARQPRASQANLFDITPDDEQQMLSESVRDFALARLRPAARAADDSCAAPADLLSQAAELGLTAVGVPEELGGPLTERSAVTSALMAEALAQGDMGIAVACLAPAAVSTALSLWGDADQQATYLHEFVGEKPPAAALAITEPRALFDPFDLRTRARRAPGGGFVLEGIKAMVPRAGDGELFVIAAGLEEGRQGLFLIEAGTSGLAVEPEPGLGVRAAATGRLILQDVELGAEALLGEADPSAYRDCVALARLGWCAVAAGAGRAALDYVKGYVNERSTFGEPISHRQAVAFTVANMAIELEGIRLATLRAASRADQGLPFTREAAVARRLVTEHGMQIGSDAVQMLGGHGYTKEHPVERWYRDLRTAGVLEGGLML